MKDCELCKKSGKSSGLQRLCEYHLARISKSIDNSNCEFLKNMYEDDFLNFWKFYEGKQNG